MHTVVCNVLVKSPSRYTFTHAWWSCLLLVESSLVPLKVPKGTFAPTQSVVGSLVSLKVNFTVVCSRSRYIVQLGGF